MPKEINLEKDNMYLTRNNKIVYVLALNSKQSYAICILVNTKLKNNDYLCIIKYYPLNGIDGNNDNYSIKRKIKYLDNDYLNNLKVIHKLQNYFKENPNNSVFDYMIFRI